MPETRQTPPPTEFDRRLRLALRLMLLALAVVYASGPFLKGINLDEIQTLRTALHMNSGQQLYIEVWDNHGPAMNHAAALWLRLTGAIDHSVLIHARAIPLACLALALVLLYRLAARLRPTTHGAFYPELVCLLAMQSEILYAKGFELRSDSPFLTVWCGALLLWFLADERRDLRHWLAAGFAIGLGFFFSFKTLLLGGAVGLMFLAVMALERRWRWMPWLAYGLGAALAVGLLAALLGLTGNLGDFIASYVGQNVDRPPSEYGSAFDKLKDSDRRMFYLSAAALAYALWALWRGRLPARIAALAVCLLALDAVFVFVLPTHYKQSLLPMLPPYALLAGWCLADACAAWKLRERLEARRLPATAIAIVGLLALAGYCISRSGWPEAEAVKTLRRAEAMEAMIPPEGEVFSVSGLPLFHPQAGKYKVFVNTLCRRHAQGLLDIDVPRQLAERDTGWIVFASRFPRLGEPTLRFAQAHYLPTSQKQLLAAGKLVEPGNATLEIAIAGTYYWQAPQATGAQARLDGKPLPPGPLHLEDGTHEIAWPGPGPLIFCLAPPGQWNPTESMRLFREADPGDYDDKDFDETCDAIW